jgi:hypothetical protein
LNANKKALGSTKLLHKLLYGGKKRSSKKSRTKTASLSDEDYFAGARDIVNAGYRLQGEKVLPQHLEKIRKKKAEEEALEQILELHI